MKVEKINPAYLFTVNSILEVANINNEVEAYRNSTTLVEEHLNNRCSRLFNLPVLQKAVNIVLEESIDESEVELALEIGSGTGIFEELFAPDWLKDRLISFDINKAVLAVAQEKSEIDIFQGNVYQLGVASESVDLAVTLNGMDSNLALRDALSEVGRCIKIGGKLIILQDLTPAFLRNLGREEDPHEDFNNYFDYLLRGIESLPEFRLVKTGGVEAIETEDRSKIKERLAKFKADFGYDFFPNLVSNIDNIDALLTNGPACIAVRRKAIGRKTEIKSCLKIISANPDLEDQLLETKRKKNQLVEWVKMEYLVAEKVS